MYGFNLMLIVFETVPGILSQEFHEEIASQYYPATNYILASYVKAVEAAGARVVPIFVKKNLAYYKLVHYSLQFALVIRPIYMRAHYFHKQYFKIISGSCFVP